MAIRFRRGTALVTKVLKNFDRAIADLELAAADIHEDRARKAVVAENNRQWYLAIQARHAMEDLALKQAAVRADRVRSNIEALVAST